MVHAMTFDAGYFRSDAVSHSSSVAAAPVRQAPPSPRPAPLVQTYPAIASGGYAPARNRTTILAVTLAVHLVALAALASARFEAREAESEQRIVSFAISEPPPAPPPEPAQEPAAPSVAAPVVAPAVRLEIPRPPEVAAAQAEPVAPAVVAVALTAPASTTVAPPRPAPPAPAPIVPPDFSAAQLRNAGPAYPYLSRKAREEGVVLLKVLVSVDGRAARLEIAESSGFERLDAAALKTVGKWRFVPASQAGRAREAWVLVPVTFSLG